MVPHAGLTRHLPGAWRWGWLLLPRRPRARLRAGLAFPGGRTPLLVACLQGHVDAARLLLDNGAEVDPATKKGTTPLAIAEERGKKTKGHRRFRSSRAAGG